MSESFRPFESSSIDAGLRTRLEGAIEVLEDALSLLDSLTVLLGRDEPARDDLETLQECVGQLPRIEEAVDQANRHEQASSLTRAVGARLKAAHLQANHRLVELGEAEVPSLRGAVSAVLAMLKSQGTAPRPGEWKLMESPGVPWLLSLGVGSAAAILAYVLALPGGPLLGALACIITLLATPSHPWVLLPDRLFFPARKGGLAREFLPRSIGGMTIQGNSVVAQAAGEALVLRTSSPKELVSLLCLLKGPWLSWLHSPAPWSVVLDAVDDETQESGRALLTVDGMLFVPKSRTGLFISALTSEPLPAPPSLDEVLRLIAHLPTQRWPALAAHLAAVADAGWFPKGGTQVDSSPNPQLGVVVLAGSRRVRLNYSGNANPDGVPALLERLIG